MTRALAMVSGGLDSILAAKLIKDQGIEVIGVCFKSYFFNESNAIKMTKQIGIELKVIDFTEEHFKMVKNPKHGRGKNMNPCIDCHAMMMTYCGRLLEELNADFIITGEVLNQRPMSQNKQALDVVRKESGFSDKILRPLCALNLNPTQMELDGLVDRNKLLKISGRSRKEQMKMAEEWGIVDYPSPAGGCKLTEPNYSHRLKLALDANKDLNRNDIELLKYGRHFISENNTKIIVTRTADEAEEIKKVLTHDDIVLLCTSHNGAMGIIHGPYAEEDIKLAGALLGRYTKGRDEDKITIKYGNYQTKFDKEFNVKPADEELINKYIIKG